MRRILAKLYRLPVFLLVGRLLFGLSRVGWLEPVSIRLARLYAWTVLTVLGLRPRSSALPVRVPVGPARNESSPIVPATDFSSPA